MGSALKAPIAYSVGGAAPDALVVADFNNDGKLDLASSTSNFPGVSVLLGNGDNSFKDSVFLPSGAGPHDIAVADLNADGFTDIAVTDSAFGIVTVILGNGDGTFQSGIGYPAIGTPIGIGIADFDQDGILDIAVANPVVSELFGNGDGSFGSPISYDAGWAPKTLRTGDFNLDGAADIAVSNDYFIGSVSVLMGNGDGTFAPRLTYSTGVNTRALVVADFNTDGYADVMGAEAFGVAIVFNAADWPPAPIDGGSGQDVLSTIASEKISTRFTQISDAKNAAESDESEAGQPVDPEPYTKAIVRTIRAVAAIAKGSGRLVDDLMVHWNI
jgi:hypothetical protein